MNPKPFPTARPTRVPALLLTALLLGAVRAEPTPDALERLLKEHQESVVFFGGAFKYLCGRCTQVHDHSVLSTAVVVDAAGLLLARAEGSLGDPKTEVRESHLRITLADGAEVPVRVLVADTDLRVVVLGVENPADARAHRFAPLRLEPVGAPKVLDDLVVLRRLDKRSGFAPQLVSVRVNAIDTKPRTTYHSVGLWGEKPLAPCFDAQGRLVGFVLGHEQAIAVEEFLDLVRQGRAALTRKATP